jgi:hypothetical protein
MDDIARQENSSASGRKSLQQERRREKSYWEKFEILSKPIAGLLTALTIALLGYWGRSTVTSIAAMDQKAQLYIELLSKREQSESMLRKDMFSVILKDFFEAAPVKSAGASDARLAAIPTDSAEIAQKLLKLEMLALNFGDSLSLKPMFLGVRRDIAKARPSESEEMGWLVKKGALTKRLHGLARRVASSQLESIKQRGETLSIYIPFKLAQKTETAQQKEFTWPQHEEAGDEEQASETKHELSKLTQNDITRITTFQFRNADYRQKTIEVDLDIATIKADGSDEPPVIKKFTLDYFNFALLDNSRLSDNQNFALILKSFDENMIVVEGVLFPGEFSSQRDRPYMTDAIQALKKGAELDGQSNKGAAQWNRP